MADTARKLGKAPPKFNRKTLTLSRYLLPTAPAFPPAKTYWEYKVGAWPMFLNDQLADANLRLV